LDTARPSLLRAPLVADLQPGRYAVVWRAVSEADGTPAQGAFSFYVAVQPTDADREADRALEREGGLPIEADDPDAVADDGGDGVSMAAFIVIGAALLAFTVALAAWWYLRRARL
jgi:hypothetical protein